MPASVAMPAVRQNRSKLAPTCCQASSTIAAGTTSAGVVHFVMALLSFVASAPRAYWLKAGNAYLTFSTSAGTSPPLAAGATIQAELWLGQVRHYLPLIERIITQAERRVLAGEAVPSGEKLVSLFETHADIIVKGGREVHYGHKLNLTTGKSGLILDVVVETGNPADAERFLPCSSATSRARVRHRDKRPAMAATPASTI